MPKIRFLMKPLDECKEIEKNKEMHYTTNSSYIYGIPVEDFKFISEQAEITGINIVGVSNRYGDDIITCSVKFKDYQNSMDIFIPVCFVDKFFDIKELTTYFPHIINLI